MGTIFIAWDVSCAIDTTPEPVVVVEPSDTPVAVGLEGSL
jgi:hypothetical protein